MAGLTTLVANLLGAGLVILPPPLLEDLAEALDDERHLLIVKLGGVYSLSTWCRLLLLLLRCLEGYPLRLGCGWFVKLVDLLGALDHTFKAHKIPNYFLGSH